jgi:hypothetical protein
MSGHWLRRRGRTNGRDGQRYGPAQKEPDRGIRVTTARLRTKLPDQSKALRVRRR